MSEDDSGSEKKSLRIAVHTDGNDNGILIPINTSEFVEIESVIGKFKVSVDVKNFKGCNEYNEENSNYGGDLEDNIKIRIEFTPTKEINGDDLIFGNDFEAPIKDYLPYGTSMGLRLFNKFVDPSCTYDLYCEKPWIYGKCLSSLNKINVSLVSAKPEDDANEEIDELQDPASWDENLAEVTGENENLAIPKDNKKRQYFFSSKSNCLKYTFLPGYVYRFQFSNDYLSLKDNKLGISLPGGFELNLTDYLHTGIKKCCNYVLKKGDLGLVVKFEYV